MPISRAIGPNNSLEKLPYQGSTKSELSCVIIKMSSM